MGALSGPVGGLVGQKKAQNGPKRAPNGRNGGGVGAGLRRLYAATNPLPMGGYETAQPGPHHTPVSAIWGPFGAILGLFWPCRPIWPKMAKIDKNGQNRQNMAKNGQNGQNWS